MRHPTFAALKSWSAVVAIGIAAGVPAVAGMAVFVNPLAADRSPEWASVGSLDALPADGAPRRVPVLFPETDAWARLPESRVGSVFLIRSPVDGRVRAYPGTYHCGAQVEFDETANQFVVPCWEGIRFASDGRRLHSVREWGNLGEVRLRVVDQTVLVCLADVSSGGR